MNESRRSPDIELSEAGEIRRSEILSRLNAEMVSLKRKRSQNRFKVVALILTIITAGLAWALLPSRQNELENRLVNAPAKIVSESTSENDFNKSAFRPSVVSNLDGLVEQHVVQSVELQTSKVDFESIDADQLDELLAETGEEIVVGRINGELRVLFVNSF